MEKDPEEYHWRQLARTLVDYGGVPRRRAEAVALVVTGHTYEDAAEEMGLESESQRSQVGQHIRRFREDVEQAEWLAENAPDV